MALKCKGLWDTSLPAETINGMIDMQVLATLNYGNLPNAANMVCSAAFDRDGEYFATAGVNRGIKVTVLAAPLFLYSTFCEEMSMRVLHSCEQCGVLMYDITVCKRLSLSLTVHVCMLAHLSRVYQIRQLICICVS